MEKEKIDSFYDKYTKKQLYDLYMDALCDEISDSRFDKISVALHETVHLGQFSKDFINKYNFLFSSKVNI